jgi:hypothetical protein
VIFKVKCEILFGSRENAQKFFASVILVRDNAYFTKRFALYSMILVYTIEIRS